MASDPYKLERALEADAEINKPLLGKGGGKGAVAAAGLERGGVADADEQRAR